MADFGIGMPDEIARLSLHPMPEPPLPPPPSARSDGLVAIDITKKFAEASRALAPGELVKDGFFTLFDSVAALEIMDPKMDSGCVESEADLEEQYDVSRALLPEEALGIMDQLLCHEMAWHLGYPLSQTLFTSVYVEALLMPAPFSIREAQFSRSKTDQGDSQPMLKVLRAYCLGMLKACGFVNDRIRSEHYYEEEDFVTNTYNRSLLDVISMDDIQDAIAEARTLVESLHGEIDGDILNALDRRLHLRSLFLKATQSPQQIREPELARKPWKEGVSLLSDIKSSHALGKGVDEAFSVKLQRKLASTMPPRPIVKLSFDDAFGHVSRLFKDGSEVIDVLNYTDPQCLQNFVSTFQAKKPQPLVYVRTLLQTFLFNEMEFLGFMSIRQILDDDFAIVTMPASSLLDRANDEIEAVHDPRFFTSQQMELFRQRAAQPFLDILRTFCQNRCRVRRTLCHIIREWENLQADAEEIDQMIQVKVQEKQMVQVSPADGSTIETYSLPLSSWTYLYKLRLMEWIVQLGFELEVYQPDEFAGMYWYLNYLAKWRVQHVERIKTFIVRKVEQTRAQSRTPDLQVDRQLERSLAFVRLSLLDSAVTWELSDALSCLYAVLARLGLIKAPPRPYSTDELRYELRMRPFAAIGLPPLPAFQEFTAGTTQPDGSTTEVLAYAERALGGAKTGLEAMNKMPAGDIFAVGCFDRSSASIKNALKSCIAAKLAINAVQKAVAKSDDPAQLNIKVEVPTPDQAYHNWWLVPKIIPLP